MIRSPRQVRALLAAVTALSLLLAACSSDDGGASDGTTTSTPADTTATEGDGGDPGARPDPGVAAAPAGEVATAEPVPSAGCGTSTVDAVEGEKRTLPDSDRWYLLTVPAEHDGDTPLPLVLDYHGLSEGAEVHSMMSAFGDEANDHGFVVVFPHGTGEPVRWDTGLDRSANPDLAYTDALLDHLEQGLCIDTSRVYATGLSNGAFMSSTLACAMSDRFAAVAPVAGVQHPDGCSPDRAVPVLGYHGTSDPILLFNGGVRADRLAPIIDGGSGGSAEEEEPLPEPILDGDGYPAAAAAWATANGCEPDATDVQRTESVISRTWTCPAQAPVLFEILEGGGHSWPGSEFSQAIESVIGPTDMTIDATAEIWAFFQRFSLPTR